MATSPSSADHHLKTIRYILLSTLLTGITGLKAQDMHFSQFNETPALINPALTGSGDLRASLNYRKQWKKVTAPFKTFGVSVETRTHSNKKKSEQSDFGKATDKPKSFLGYGLSVFRDAAGDGKMVLSQFNLSGAAFVPTGDQSYFSLGLQSSYARRKFNGSNFLFPNQYAEGGYDPGIESGESAAGTRFGYLDLGAGVQWMFNREDRMLGDHKEFKMHVGAAVYHLNSPKQKFIREGVETMPVRIVGHADVLFSIPKTRLVAVPTAIFQMQGNNMEIIGGALIKYKLNDNLTRYTNYTKQTNVCAGVYYRTFDAVIIQGMMEWEQFAVGLSYDLNVSGLRPASHMRGGTEIVLRYSPGDLSHYEKLEKKK